MKKWLKRLAGLAVFLMLILAMPYAIAAVIYILEKTDNKSSFAQEHTATPVVQKEKITPDGLFIAINKVRAKNNLAQFKRNSLLDKSAQLKCDDMVKNNYYEHKNPKTGKQGYSYINDVGANPAWMSENLNQGTFVNSKSVVNSWMESESHAASILDARYSEIGFAVCVIPSAKDELTVVQHKMEPSQQPAVIQQTPQYSLPEKTYCTHYGGGYGLNARTSCTTY